MILTLAFRHLAVRRVRALVLLVGFSLGVGVMIVLLSVGEAMLEQSRDVALVGGGEITVLPQGIDVEAMRTGGLSGMFFGIDRARFVTRQLLGGARERGIVRTVAPAIESKLLYLSHAGRTVPVRVGGEIPSRAAAVGASLRIVAGRWVDAPEDSQYIAPTRQQLYDDIDHFHLPARPDSAWAEWHYFNVVLSPVEWWYVTYLVGGEIGHGRWGGQLLITHRRADGRYERFDGAAAPDQIVLDTLRADLTLGGSAVQQRDGVYHLTARAGGPAGPVRIDLQVRPQPNRYFPPVTLASDAFLSGYVAPGLVAEASGTVCVAARCRRIDAAPAYHDHNWGVWREVTWEWGAARGERLAVLYGGVYQPALDASAAPFFLTAIDSLGVRQVLRFHRIDYAGARPVPGAPGVVAPERFDLVAGREGDTLRLSVHIDDVHATAMGAAAFRRYFLQMRGRFTVTGRFGTAAVADSGAGFFETYVRGRPAP